MTRLDPDVWARLAQQLAGEDDLDLVLRRVVQAAMALIEGTERAGVTMLDHRSPRTQVASDELVRQVDRHQYATGQGPYLSTILKHEPFVLVDDLLTDPRWPDFGASAAEFGVRSMLSMQLHTDAGHDGGAGGRSIGALNVYASAPGAFTDESVQAGLLLATHATVAASAAARCANLRIAIQSRDTIGQAKGVLMERYKITADQAFQLMVMASQQGHHKLKDIAAEVASTGELRLPTPPPTSKPGAYCPAGCQPAAPGQHLRVAGVKPHAGDPPAPGADR